MIDLNDWYNSFLHWAKINTTLKLDNYERVKRRPGEHYSAHSIYSFPIKRATVQSIGHHGNATRANY